MCMLCGCVYVCACVYVGQTHFTSGCVPHRKENNLDGNGFPLGSEQIIYNKDFRPYAGLHTYTVSIAPGAIPISPLMTHINTHKPMRSGVWDTPTSTN